MRVRSGSIPAVTSSQGIAGPMKSVIVYDVAWTNQFDARSIKSAFGELPRERSGLSSRHEHKQRIGLKIASALQERRKIRIGEWYLQRLETAPALDEMPLKELLPQRLSVQSVTMRSLFAPSLNSPVRNRDSRCGQA